MIWCEGVYFCSQPNPMKHLFLISNSVEWIESFFFKLGLVFLSDVRFGVRACTFVHNRTQRSISPKKPIQIEKMVEAVGIEPTSAAERRWLLRA